MVTLHTGHVPLSQVEVGHDTGSHSLVEAFTYFLVSWWSRSRSKKKEQEKEPEKEQEQCTTG